jgi:hypothetical protein
MALLRRRRVTIHKVHRHGGLLIRIKHRQPMFEQTDTSIRGDELMPLPHTFKRIRLHLARSKEFPNGSAAHGYEFVAPLDRDGHIDTELWKSHREQCRVRRFWRGEVDQTGLLVHKPGGSEHARWVFDYDRTSSEDDEAGYRFGSHRIEIGEYITLRDRHTDHTFKIVAVENAS